MINRLWQTITNLLCLFTGIFIFFSYGTMDLKFMTIKDHLFTFWGLLLLIFGGSPLYSEFIIPKIIYLNDRFRQSFIKE